jgi:hypothetical protein
MTCWYSAKEAGLQVRSLCGPTDCVRSLVTFKTYLIAGNVTQW